MTEEQQTATEGQNTSKETEKTEEPEKSERETNASGSDKVVTYEVGFTGTSASNGIVRVDGSQIDVSSYKKTVEKDREFVFEAIANDGWKVKNVKADNADIPKANNGNDNAYRIANVTKATVIDIVYEELPAETTGGGRM